MNYKEKVIALLNSQELSKEQKEKLERIFPELKESEDEKIRENIIATIHLYYGEPLEDEAKEMVAWLEKQGEQILANSAKTCKDEPKQEWNEEDETGLTNTIIMLKEGASLHFNKKDIAKAVEWLNSLRPQNKWKPSDEQIEALESATENCAYSEYQDCLRELIAQLKKLKG